MRRPIRLSLIALASGICADGRAQDAGIGLKDSRSIAERNASIGQGKAAMKSLFEVGQDYGGVSDAINGVGTELVAVANRGVAEGVEKLKSRLESQATSGNAPTLGESGDALMDGYIDSASNADIANGEPSNDTVARAADDADAKACAFFPASCPEKPRPDPPTRREPRITDKNIILLCNPLNVGLGSVVADSQLAYRNECSWGVYDSSYPSNFRSVKVSIIACSGWENSRVVSSSTEIVGTRGFAGMQDGIDKATGQPMRYATYSGARFEAPCKPGPAASNPLTGGCLNLGLLKIGKC